MASPQIFVFDEEVQMRFAILSTGPSNLANMIVVRSNLFDITPGIEIAYRIAEGQLLTNFMRILLSWMIRRALRKRCNIFQRNWSTPPG